MVAGSGLLPRLEELGDVPLHLAELQHIICARGKSPCVFCQASSEKIGQKLAMFNIIYQLFISAKEGHFASFLVT